MEEIYCNIFLNSPTPTLVVSKVDDYIIEVNEAASLLYGYTKEELTLIKYSNLISFDMDEMNQFNYQIHKKSDNTVVEVRITTHDLGKYLIIFIEDRTEIMNYEKKYSASQDFYSDILDFIPAGVFINSFKPLYVNQAVEKLLGYTKNEWLNFNQEDWIKIFNKDDMIEVENNKEVNKSEYNPMTMRILTKSGIWKWFYHCFKIIEFDTNGVPIKFLGVALDITEKVELENQLKELNKELKNKIEELELQNITLKNKMEVQIKTLQNYLLEKNKVIAEVNKTLVVQTKDKIESIRQIINSDVSWESIISQFIEIYPNFVNNLNERYSDLTMTERKICGLIILKMKTNEISDLLFISPRTVEKHRQKIREKCNLPKENSLEDFLKDLI